MSVAARFSQEQRENMDTVIRLDDYRQASAWSANKKMPFTEETLEVIDAEVSHYRPAIGIAIVGAALIILSVIGCLIGAGIAAILA